MPAIADSPMRRMIRQVVPAPVRATWWDWVAARHRRRIQSGQAHEPAVARALRRLIEPGAYCADVGANYGFLSVVMARKAGPQGKVFAFEPHPKNVQKLRETLARCDAASTVIVEPVAVSDGSVDQVSLHPGRGSRDLEWNIVGHDVDGSPTPAELNVRAIALDQYFADAPRLDLVKIDVEGAEGLVLAGMQQVLLRLRPVLLIEVHSQENWPACVDLTNLGYRLTDLRGRAVGAVVSRSQHILALP